MMMNYIKYDFRRRDHPIHWDYLYVCAITKGMVYGILFLILSLFTMNRMLYSAGIFFIFLACWFLLLNVVHSNIFEMRKKVKTRPLTRP